MELNRTSKIILDDLIIYDSKNIKPIVQKPETVKNLSKDEMKELINKTQQTNINVSNPKLKQVANVLVDLRSKNRNDISAYIRDMPDPHAQNAKLLEDEPADYMVSERRMEVVKKIRTLPKKSTVSYNMYFSSNEEIKRRSVVTLTNATTEHRSGSCGPNDMRMGCIKPRSYCITCSRDYENCEGHHGKIDLNTPLVNPIARKQVIDILNCTCSYCGHILATEEFISNMKLNKFSGPNYIKKLSEHSNSISSFHNHPHYTKKVYLNVTDDYKVIYKEGNKTPCEDILNIIAIFDNYNDLDLKLLRMTGKTHPRNMIMQYVSVSPLQLRPPMLVNNKMTENPYTLKYVEIIKINMQLNSSPGMDSAVKTKLLNEIYTKLKEIFVGQDSQSTNKMKGDKNIGYLNGFSRKTGLIRQYAMAKRVNFSARGVANPLNAVERDFGDLGVPSIMAEKLTVPEKVTEYNIDRIKRDIQNKEYVSIKHMVNNEIKKLKIDNDYPIKIPISIGCDVERPIRDNDDAVAGRQPTLHKASQMGFRIKKHNNEVIELHEVNDGPFNCDYDGDELTIHIPQTIAGMVEVRTLMNTKNYIMNDQNNRPMIGIAFYGLFGGYIMTSGWDFDGKTNQELIIPETRWRQILSVIPNSPRKRTLERRCLDHNIPIRSGRALASLTLPISLTYKGSGLEIIDGIIIKGELNKGNLGTGNNSLVHIIFKMFSNDEAARFINEFSKVANWIAAWHNLTMGHRTFSTNRTEIQEKMRTDINKVQMRFYELGAIPTDDIDIFFWKQRSLKMFDNARNSAKNIGNSYLNRQNELNILGKKGSGGKGSDMNTSQITGCLGFQIIKGDHPKKTFNNKTRCIPMFIPGDCSLSSIGFVNKSFFDGLSPSDLFFHLCSSREGLVDTANNTSDIGYTHRRIEKCLENDIVDAAGMISSSNGKIYQFTFDGFNAAHQISIVKPDGEKVLTFIDFKATVNMFNRTFEYIKKNKGEIPEEAKNIFVQPDIPEPMISEQMSQIPVASF